MKLLTRIFHNFFLPKIVNFFKSVIYFIFILIFSKNLIANNEKSESSILDRLPTSIFATVNEEVISIYDLILRSNLFSVSAKIPINEEFEIRILPDLISGYIDEVIQMQEMKKEKIFVSDNQVKEMVLQIEKENGFKKGKLKEFLKKKHLGITEYLAQKTKSSNQVMLIYNSNISVSPLTTHIPLKSVNKSISKIKIINIKNKQLNEKYTLASFIEGTNNQFAKAAARNVAESPGKQSFNPLVIYGGVGMGKTHLLHAIGNRVFKEKNSNFNTY